MHELNQQFESYRQAIIIEIFELYQQAIKSEATYHIIIPIAILTLGWLKNRIDINKKNKMLGYWKLRYRRGESFDTIVFKLYSYYAFNQLIWICLVDVLSSMIGHIISNIICGSIFVLINIFILYKIKEKAEVKLILYENRKRKNILLYLLFVLMGISFYINFFDLIGVAIIVLSLIIWFIYAFKYSDTVYILDNRIADIHVTGSDKIEAVFAGDIIKRGEWLYIYSIDHQYDGKFKQIRIKESNVIRIDYYGEPVIIVKKIKSNQEAQKYVYYLDRKSVV